MIQFQKITFEKRWRKNPYGNNDPSCRRKWKGFNVIERRSNMPLPDK